MKKTVLSMFVIGAAAVSQAAVYQLTITNLGPQPLSPLFYAASNGNFNSFSVGGASSVGIKNIAERGNAAAMTGIAAASSDVLTHGVLGASPLTPGNTRTTTFTTDASHNFFSFASMLGQTNDGWIGESVSSMPLNISNGFSLTIFGNRAWDAGTELNTQNAADLGFRGGSGNPADSNLNIRVHGGIVSGVGDSWELMPAWQTSTALARIDVRAVPEPASLAALGLGALMLIRRGRKS